MKYVVRIASVLPVIFIENICGFPQSVQRMPELDYVLLCP